MYEDNPTTTSTTTTTTDINLGGTEKFDIFDSKKQRNKKKKDQETSKLKSTAQTPKKAETATKNISTTSTTPQQQPTSTTSTVSHQHTLLPSISTLSSQQTTSPSGFVTQEQFGEMSSMMKQMYNAFMVKGPSGMNTPSTPPATSNSMTFFGSPQSTTLPFSSQTFHPPYFPLAPLSNINPSHTPLLSSNINPPFSSSLTFNVNTIDPLPSPFNLTPNEKIFTLEDKIIPNEEPIFSSPATENNLVTPSDDVTSATGGDVTSSLNK